MSRRSMICVVAMLLSACASQPAKLQDLGDVVSAPVSRAPIPPATMDPLKYSFQTRLQDAFKKSPTMPTP